MCTTTQLRTWPILLVGMFFLVACGQQTTSTNSTSGSPSAPDSPTSTRVTLDDHRTASPTHAAKLSPATQTPASSSLSGGDGAGQAAEPSGEQGYGKTADGYYFLGRADAPVTLVDYSDFL